MGIGGVGVRVCVGLRGGRGDINLLKLREGNEEDGKQGMDREGEMGRTVDIHVVRMKKKELTRSRHCPDHDCFESLHWHCPVLREWSGRSSW